MICARLRAAGIEAIAQGGAFAATASDFGARDIYVGEDDLARARELLTDVEGISEAELIRAEEQAAGEGAGQDRE